MKILLKIFCLLLLPFQSCMMLFVKDDPNTVYTIYDMLCNVMAEIVIGILFLNVRDVIRVWNDIFKWTGYIFLFYAFIYFATYKSWLFFNYWFVLSCVLPYPIAISIIVYKHTHTFIKIQK